MKPHLIRILVHVLDMLIILNNNLESRKRKPVSTIIIYVLNLDYNYFLEGKIRDIYFRWIKPS